MRDIHGTESSTTFVNDGETVMTTRIYTDPLSTSVELFSEARVANLIKLDSWTLNDIWR
ncbi:GH32 C-terminal domain-containing protein [Neobacillus sp. BF23-41]|uniref:GH32 C-terminal domain-containing protein n=1 Tax=Neobacillus sp. BF23-41 TaxID=3240280 RepID=UPI0034E3D957